jgi:hypothetical protein
MQQSLLKFSKTKVACDECRRTRTRCEGGTPCLRCVRKKKTCAFVNAKKPFSEDAPAPHAASPSTLKENAPSPSISLHAVLSPDASARSPGFSKSDAALWPPSVHDDEIAHTLLNLKRSPDGRPSRPRGGDAQPLDFDRVRVAGAARPPAGDEASRKRQRISLPPIPNFDALPKPFRAQGLFDARALLPPAFLLQSKVPSNVGFSVQSMDLPPSDVASHVSRVVASVATPPLAAAEAAMLPQGKASLRFIVS